MSRPLPLNPTFLPPTYGVLKSLLENPLKLPLAHEDGEASRAAAAPRSPRRPSAPLAARPEMAAQRRPPRRCRPPRGSVPGRLRCSVGRCRPDPALVRRRGGLRAPVRPQPHSSMGAESREGPEVPQSRGRSRAVRCGAGAALPAVSLRGLPNV